MPTSGPGGPTVPVAVSRLKRRSEFLRVAAARRKWAAPGLVLQAAPAQGATDGSAAPPAGDSRVSSEQGLRLGFTSSKKVGNAVARNRARRRLRAAAALVMAREAAPGFDYVLIAREQTLHRPFALLLQDLQTALKRVGAYRKGGGASGPAEGRPTDREAP